MGDPVRREVSAEQLVFTVVMIVFVGTLLVQSLGYRLNVRLVPQVIGFPTLVSLFVVLARDVRQLVRGSSGVVEQDPHIVGDTEDLAISGDLGDALLLAKRAQEDDSPEELTVDSRRRLLVFGGWVVAFAFFSDWLDFRITVPVGLFLIFYYARRRVVQSALIAVIVSAVFYALFVTFLSIRF